MSSCWNCGCLKNKIIKEVNSGKYEFMKNQWLKCVNCGNVKYYEQIPMGVLNLE